MPVIEIKMWEGRSREQKQQLVDAITKAFMDQGVPAPAIHVVIHNVKKEDWAIGGKLCDE